MASTPIKAIGQVAITPEVAQRYSLANNTFIQKAAPDPVNGNIVEIGDSKQADFYLQFKIMRWGNATNFSARLVDLDATPATLETVGNAIRYKKAAYEVHFYDLGFDDETGGFQVDLVLNSKPTTNIIQWTIQTKGLDFFPQGELTPEELADGAQRQDDIIDSIAIYHSSKKHNFVGGKNYGTGKAGHSKRIQLIDANSLTAWAKQDINVQTELWTWTLPQAFLDAAVYPVVVR